MENKWERVSLSGGESERLYSKARSFAGDVWFRFRHKPTALLGLILALIMILFAVIGPFFTPYDYSEQETKMANIPPLMTVYSISTRTSSSVISRSSTSCNSAW